MNIITVTPPTVEPVTLAEVWTHLRLDPSGSPLEHPDDDLLAIQIAAARQDAEKQTLRSFVYQTLKVVGPTFPEFIELYRPPVIEIVSVTYWDRDNAQQTVSSDDYYVTEDLVPRLMFESTFSVPAVYERNDAVAVTYRAGYAPEGSPDPDYTTNIPAPIKAAILLGVQLQYDDLAPDRRKALENARDSLLSSYHVFSIA